MLGDAVSKLKSRCPKEFLSTFSIYWQKLISGAVCWEKAPSFNYMRICLSALINHIFKFLEPDLSNYYEAACKAIEGCGVHQTSTRRNIKRAAIHFSQALVAEGLLDKSVLEKLRTIKIKRTRDPKRPVIYYKDLQRLIKIIKGSKNRELMSKELDLIIIIFLFFSGCRVGELVSLQLSNIDLENNRIQILWSKHGKSRWIGINKDLVPYLMRYLKEIRPYSKYGNAFLLPNGEPLTVDRIQKRIKRLTNKAGLDGGAHQFRAGMATYFHHERNVPLEALSKVLGHEDTRTTMIYVRSDTETIVKEQVNW